MRNLQSTLWTPANCPATNHEALLQHPTEDRLLTPEEMQLVRGALLNMAVSYRQDYKTRAFEAINEAAETFTVALRK